MNLSHILLGLILILLSGLPERARATEPTVPEIRGFSPDGTYGGTPGAQVFNLEYADGMNLKVALYSGKRGASSELPPVGIIAGYTLDFSYLNYMAEVLISQGFPVFLVQPPGNGSGAMRSGFRDHRDGYSNTIEGFASMYMDGLGETLSRHYGKKIVLMGHSRAGYQVRFFLTGLRYAGTHPDGSPILTYSQQALERANEHFLSLVSLYSPISPDERLVSLAGRIRDSIERMNEFERLMRREQEFFVNASGNGAAFLAATSPLNLVWGLLAPFAAIANAELASKVTRNHVRGQFRVLEDVAKERTLSLMLGERDLDGQDRMFFEFMRRRYGSRVEVPAFEQLRQDLKDMRWMGGGADRKALAHLMEFASRETPTQETEREMLNLAAKKDGISGWTTEGLNPEGKPYSLLKALHKARKKAPIPYYIFDAEGDGGPEATEIETRLACANGSCRVQGTHGGAVLNRASINQAADHLRGFCLALLTPKDR